MELVTHSMVLCPRLVARGSTGAAIGGTVEFAGIAWSLKNASFACTVLQKPPSGEAIPVFLPVMGNAVVVATFAIVTSACSGLGMPALVRRHTSALSATWRCRAQMTPDGGQAWPLLWLCEGGILGLHCKLFWKSGGILCSFTVDPAAQTL